MQPKTYPPDQKAHTPTRSKQKSQCDVSFLTKELIWNERGSWVLVSVVVQALAFPFFLGRSGFLVATLTTAALAAVLAIYVLQLKLARNRVFGLMLLTVTFMNVDAIVAAPEFAGLGRLSWLLTFLFVLYLASVRREILHSLERHPILVVFALFTMMIIIWSLFAGRFSLIFQRQLFFLFIFWIAAEFLTYDKRTAIALLYGILLAGMSVTAMLIMEFNFPEYLGISSTIQRGGGVRTAALYVNANMAAYAISFSAIVLGLLTKLGFPRRWAIFIFLFIIIGMLSTFSRKGAPWLIFAIIGLVVAFVAQRSQKKRRYVTSIVLASFFTTAIGYALVNSDYIKQLDIRQGEQRRLLEMGAMLSGDTETYVFVFESSGRARLSEASWRAIQRYPWFGYGPMASGISRDVPEFQPHNLFLLLWVEYGIFNLLLFSALLVAAFFKILRKGFFTRLYGMLFVVHLLVMMLGAHTLLHNRVGAITLALVLVFDQLQVVQELDRVDVV